MSYRAHAIAGLLGLLVQAAAAQTPIRVGVLSPIDGSRTVGVDHEDTAKFAFERNRMVMGLDGVAFQLEAILANDESVADTAVAEARKLVENEGVVAILGPVDSSSTLAVIRANLGVPVITALSSATALSDPERDRWFFRMTLTDKERMRRYATTLLNHRSYVEEPRFILYDDTSEYGKGLHTDLAAALGVDEQSARPWNAVADLARVTPRPASIFVLGSSLGALSMAREIGVHLGIQQGSPGYPRLLFVGDDADLRDGAPRGSITIGEPTIVDAAPGSAIAKLRDEYAAVGRRPDRFQVTTFEAANFVIPEAVSAVIKAHSNTIPPLPDFRDALREQLENGTFSSIEVRRRISLRGGTMHDAPEPPVYELMSGMRVIEPGPATPFATVALPDHIGYFEGPVQMKVRLHNTNEMPAARVFRARGEGHVIVGSKVTPSGDEYVVTFYPKVPGRYQLDLGGLAADPATPTTLVSLTPTYLIAVLAALLGSVLFGISVKDAAEKKRWRRRLVLGVLTGCAFAVLHFNRSLIPGGMAFPTLGETPILAAFWGGLAGGWIGPTALLLVIGRLLPGLPNAFGTGGDPKPAPSKP
jgi:substrate-binding family protein